MAFDDVSINGHVLAGTHAQRIADLNINKRDIPLLPVRADPARGLG